MVAGSDERTCSVLCYRCRSWGHYADHCPTVNDSENASGIGQQGTGLTQIGHNLSQGTEKIPDHWILLDSCSTNTVFNNCAFLNDIVACKDSDCLELRTNGGRMIYYLTSKVKMFPINCHYNEHSMANIISLFQLMNIDDIVITLDNRIGTGFKVIYGNKLYRFLPYNHGLFYYDTTVEPENITIEFKNEVNPYSFLQTVDDNKEYFTATEIKGAEAARFQQEEIGWPSDSFYHTIIKENLLTNTEVTIDDVHRAEHIFGPAKPLLEGTMTRQRPTTNKIEKVPLPLPITTHQTNVDLSIDFFYVNGHVFFTSKSRKLNFVTAKYHQTRTMKSIINTLNEIRQIYSTRGFKIENIHGDNEFNKDEIKQSQLPATFHAYGKDEHVGLIERSNRTVKNKARTMTHAVPYQRMPKLMVIGLVHAAVKWINVFPSKNGVSKSMSPATIVLGSPKPNMKYKRIVFGSYAMAYAGTSNKMKSRSIPAIALNPSNEHGGHYFISLYTGKRLNSYEWKELPIDEDVIDRINELAEKEEAPLMKKGYPVFTWKRRLLGEDDTGINGTDDDLNDTYNQNQGAREQLNNFDANDIQANDDHDEAENDNEDDEQGVIVDGYITEDDTNEDEITGADYEERSVDTGTVNDTIMDDDESINDTHQVAIDMDSHDIIEEPDKWEEPHDVTEEVIDDGVEVKLNSAGRPKRQCAGAGIERLEISLNNSKEYATSKKQKYHFTMKSVNHPFMRGGKSFMSVAANVLFVQVNEHAQMSAKAGIKKFGDRAIAAMLSEYKQLNTGVLPGKPVFGYISPDSITFEEKRGALDAVNLIKKKRSGKIKGRTCANGSKQKRYLKHGENISSPTVSLEAIIGTLLIDANEDRDVAIFDIPGAYLHAEMPEGKKLLMKFRDEFVDIMCQVNPEYKKHVIEEKGKKVLYVKILRAIYGCIESALLWYELYVKTLKGMGFKLNPYDRCVANKTINGKQCTITWYVDDNKISHVDPKVVTTVLEAVKEHFGDLDISRGNEHDLLGMKIIIDRDKKNISINMTEQLKEALEMFGEEVDSKVTTPANKNLLTTYNGECEELDKNRSEVFHSVTAKLLFIMKRGRPDIETTISYLMTRVSKSNERDWEKLKRCLGFIKGTINDKRIIGASSLRDLHVWIDASHAVHENMRGHTGGTMSMGTGTLHNKSSKQKLNTRSTTESELVGLSEYLPYDLWQFNFFKEQGYDIRNNIIYQDNQSTIKMAINGRNSCTGNSRHVDIKYFWVKDRVDKKEVEIQYCPTTLMLADFFTKPLQGNLFRRFRAVIMGYVHINDLLMDPDFLLKERVENSMNIVTRKSVQTLNKNDRMTYNAKLMYADAVQQGEPQTENLSGFS